MKKLLGTVLVGSMVVGGVTLVRGASAASTPEGKMCVRLADMCPGDATKPMTLDECVGDMKEMRKVAGKRAFEKTQQCVDEADSCAAASGCIAGGIGVGAMGEMLKGFGNALTK